MRRFIPIAVIAVVVAAALFLLLKKPADGGDEDEGSETASVVTVQTALLKRMTLRAYVDAYGSVQGAPAEGGQPPASARIASPSAGVLAKAYVAEGDAVRKGQRLFDLDDRAAKVAVARAEQLAKYAEDEANRQRRLLAAENSSAKAVQDAEAQAASAAADLAAARTQLAWLHIVAPLAGVVTKINVNPGEAVDTTTPIAEITDLERLVISADIPAGDANVVRRGEAVEILVQPQVQAAVNYVSPTVDPATNTVRVWSALPPGSGLRPGQYVRLRIVTEVHNDVLAAPAASVVTNDDGKPVVSVVTGDEAEQKPVTVGLKDGDWVEIQAPGLKPGDPVVTVGAYGLPEKTKVQIVR